MHKRMSARRRDAFLRALAATGNITLSAERAKVSRSWVLKARKADPEFDAACIEAEWESFETLAASADNKPAARGWGHLDGVALVVRGSNRRRVQIARARVREFSPATENRFLAVLPSTCSVKAACAAIGISKGAAYAHRRRWPGFARRWDAAIEEGAIRLEFALATAHCNPFSSPELPGPAPMPAMGAGAMLHNLHMHKNQLFGAGKRPGLWPRRRPSIEVVVDGIVERIEAIRRGRSIDPKALERDREAFARRGGG